MSKRLKKTIVILSSLCVVFTTAVVPIFATSTDTTSHRPTYPLSPFEGNLTINLSNDYGVNREDVYTLSFDANTSIPIPSLGDSTVTASDNILSTKQTLLTETNYKTLKQYLRYIPSELVGTNAIMVNSLTADSQLKEYLASNSASSTSISFHIDDLYIPYRNNRPNLYYLPSVTLNMDGVTSVGFTNTRYVYYSYTSYSYDASGALTAKATTYTVLCEADSDNSITFPLIPYARPLPSTGDETKYQINATDITQYTQGFKAMKPTFDNAIPILEQSSNFGGAIRLGNLNVTVLIPTQQKPYIDDGELEMNYSSVYYKPTTGTATNSKQNALATAYTQGLIQRYSVPTDTNWFDWIVDSVGAFLDIRIIGNLTLGTVFGLIFSVPLLILVLRSFDGG